MRTPDHAFTAGAWRPLGWIVALLAFAGVTLHSARPAQAAVAITGKLIFNAPNPGHTFVVEAPGAVKTLTGTGELTWDLTLQAGALRRVAVTLKDTTSATADANYFLFLQSPDRPDNGKDYFTWDGVEVNVVYSNIAQKGQTREYAIHVADLAPSIVSVTTKPLIVDSTGGSFDLGCRAKDDRGITEAFADINQLNGPVFTLPLTRKSGSAMDGTYGTTFNAPANPGTEDFVYRVSFRVRDEKGQEATKGWYLFGVVAKSKEIRAGVDFNSDGTIDLDGESDVTNSTNRRYRFWLNTDRDQEGEVYEADPGSGVQPNYFDARVNGMADLEDLARIKVRLSGAYSLTDPRYHLRAALKGTGSVNLWTSPFRGTEYLVNPSVARLGQRSMNTPTRLVANAPAVRLRPFSPTWAEDKYAYLLFEGCTAGLGTLVIEIWRDDVKLSSASIYLDLKTVANMFEHWTVGDHDNTGPPDEALFPKTPKSLGFRYSSTSPEENTYILYVHGWRMQPWERRAFAATAFKRLRRLGYRGRFGLFSWPTEYTDAAAILASALSSETLQNYDRSEWKAYLAAEGLRKLLVQLKATYSSGQVHLFAHSMGNVVVGEAFRLHLLKTAQTPDDRQLLSTYVASQAAIAAHCYDPAAPVTYFAPDGVPNFYASYPSGDGKPSPYLKGVEAVAGRFVNYYNPYDFALRLWRANQKFKPDLGYEYFYRPAEVLPHVFVKNRDYVHPLPFPKHQYELFAHAIPTRSYPLGAQNGVQGAFAGDEFNLNVQLGYGAAYSDHSAQFGFSMPEGRGYYWIQLMMTFFGRIPEQT